MDIRQFISEDRIQLELKGSSKQEIIEELAQAFLKDEEILKTDKYHQVIKEVMEREELSSTGMQEGIAIPHIKTECVEQLKISIGISKEGKDFDSLDGKKSKIFFLVVSPKNNNRQFMKVLSTIAGLSMEEDKLEDIVNCNDKNKIIEIVSSLCRSENE